MDDKAAGDHVSSNGASQAGSSCPTPEVPPLESNSGSLESLDNLHLRYGTVIPNRIFVGGFDFKMTENELWHIFSQYGAVREVNIVNSRTRLSKGYGFVTFENTEDARKLLLLDVNGIYIRDKKLSIRPAVRKQHSSASRCQVFSPDPVPSGTVCLTTSSGYPYTFHNGVAYFQMPRVSAPPHWPTTPAPPVMLSQPCQPVYHQPAYHHYQPRYFPNRCHWNNVEAPAGSSPFVYAQPEYLHHVPDGNSAHHLDDSEHFEPATLQSYPVYPLRAERLPRFVSPCEHAKTHVYSPLPVPQPPPYPYTKDCSCFPEQLEPADPQPPPSQA